MKKYLVLSLMVFSIFCFQSVLYAYPTSVTVNSEINCVGSPPDTITEKGLKVLFESSPYGYNVGVSGGAWTVHDGSNAWVWDLYVFVESTGVEYHLGSLDYYTDPTAARIAHLGEYVTISVPSDGYVYFYVRDSIPGDNVGSVTASIEVVAPPPPTADAGPDQVVFDTATLDGSASSDPDGTIVSYDWELRHRQNPDFDRLAQGETTIVTGLQPGFYDVTLTVTDNGGSTGSDTMLLAVAGSCFCTGNEMHIQSILAGTNKNKYGKVTVTVFDDCGNPVPSAQVTGTFTGDFGETGSAVTDASGVAVIYTTATATKPSYTFCVVSVAKGTMVYDSTDNLETCKSK